MKVGFSPDAWEQYTEWQKNNNIVRKINSLIKDIQRNGLSEGIGKPERLKYRAEWSRRIDKKNRLVYGGDEHEITIYSCKGHYPDKDKGNFKDQAAEYPSEEKPPFKKILREASEIQAEKKSAKESFTDKFDHNKDKNESL